MKTSQDGAVAHVSCQCLALLCATCLMISACGSAAKNVESAKQGVEQFHSQLDSEQYAAIYAASDEKVQKATTASDFVKFMRAAHQKLGNVQQSSLRNSGVAWFAGQGATVTLVYDTSFANGSAAEPFVWHLSDNRAVLYGYHINSNDLVAR